MYAKKNNKATARAVSESKYVEKHEGSLFRITTDGLCLGLQESAVS